MKREMREETGIECEPETLVCVQMQGTAWYRGAYALRSDNNWRNYQNKAGHRVSGRLN
jgi:8-oxo-dGTP pyrophosphatase MutT (NUDIX family)